MATTYEQVKKGTLLILLARAILEQVAYSHMGAGIKSRKFRLPDNFYRDNQLCETRWGKVCKFNNDIKHPRTPGQMPWDSTEWSECVLGTRVLLRELFQSFIMRPHRIHDKQQERRKLLKLPYQSPNGYPVKTFEREMVCLEILGNTPQETVAKLKLPPSCSDSHYLAYAKRELKRKIKKYYAENPNVIDANTSNLSKSTILTTIFMSIWDEYKETVNEN